MKRKQLLTKVMLAAAMLCGSVSAWASSTTTSAGALDNSTPWNHNNGEEPATYYDDWVTTYFTLSGNTTLNFTFTTTNATSQGYYGWSLFVGNNNWSGNIWNTWMICRGGDAAAWTHTAAGSQTPTASNTYSGENSIVQAMNGATVNMSVTRDASAITVVATVTPTNGDAEFTETFTYTYGGADDTSSDIYLTFAVDNAYVNLTSFPYKASVYGDLTEETYDFTTNSTSSSSTSAWGEIVNTNYYILSNSYVDMKARFAGQKYSTNGSGGWTVTAKSAGLQNTNSNSTKGFCIRNLVAGDYVTINYNTYGTYNITFQSGNITGQTGTVGTGTTYKINSSGNLFLTFARYATVQSIVIATSAPVLSAPTITFNSMVANDGLYYPKVTFSSSDDGVTFYDGDGNDITSGYTFPAAGTLSVYAGKSGRTNSAKVSYTVTDAQVGMILAKSVSASSLDGTINYSNGNSVAYNTDMAGTWAIPGLNFESTNWTYYSSTVKPTSGNRTLSCSVLNENRIATLKHKYYSTGNTIYDYLTSSKNSYTFSRSGQNYDEFQQYDLYVSPSETVSVTIGSTGFSTFSSPVPLDFSEVDGLTAYVATAVADGNVTLTSVETAPANTGLVLKGTAGTEYTIPVTASAAAPASNLLVGCIVSTTVAADATSGFNNYVLVNNSGTPEFQSLDTNGATITAGKAFLKNGAYSPSARSLQIVFGDETTGVGASLMNRETMNKEVYNLNGQRVSQPAKGLYIVSGKKVIIK